MGRITSLQNEITSLQAKLSKNNTALAAHKKRDAAIKEAIKTHRAAETKDADAVVEKIEKLVA